MNILLIHQYFQEKDDPGGMRWNIMTGYWASLGHKITVIAGMTHYTKGIRNPKYNKKYIHVDEFAENIKVIRCHVSSSYNNNFKGRFRAYFSFVISGILGGLFKARSKYDVIVVSSPPLSVGMIALVLSLFKRTPFVFEVRDLWPESAIDTGILKNKTMIRLSYLLEKSLYKRSKLINVVTPAMKEILIKYKNVNSDKIITIPNAADMDIVNLVSASTNIPAFRKTFNAENKLVLCYVGAHGVANHLIQLIEAAEQLKNEPVLFILIGDGMQKNMLVRSSEERKLQNISFIDSVSKEDAIRYILASDIGLSVLKKADTFKTVYSNKTFDYMSCKKPVIMLIDGASRKLIEEADAGIYAEPENTDEFVAAIKKYLTDAGLRVQHGENGFEFVNTYFERKKLAFNYIGRLEEQFGLNSKIKEGILNKNV